MRGEGRMVLAGGEVARRTQSGGGIGLPVNNRVFSSSFLLGFWSFDFSSLFYTNFLHHSLGQVWMRSHSVNKIKLRRYKL
jgi:hypothetical protein